MTNLETALLLLHAAVFFTLLVPSTERGGASESISRELLGWRWPTSYIALLCLVLSHPHINIVLILRVDSTPSAPLSYMIAMKPADGRHRKHATTKKEKRPASKGAENPS